MSGKYFLGLAIVTFAARFAVAQSASTPPVQVPVILSNTSAVSIDVVVTRGKDEPVTGLHKQDFVLLEDGRPQAVDFFEEHTALVSSTAAVPLVAMPPHVFTNVPQAPVSDAVNVLLLDMLNTPRPDQSYVREQILSFLRTMKPDARIAIFALGTKLSLLQGFTDDPALLRAALANEKTGFRPKTTGVSRSREDEDDDKNLIAMRQANLGAAGRSTAGIQAMTRGLAEIASMESDQRIAITLDALQKLGRYLAGIPGRKNLIWFASQYPVYLFPDSGEKQPHVYARDHSLEIKATADTLILSKVAVYPIDAEAMMDDHPMDAEHDLQAAGMGAGLLHNTMDGAGDRASKMSAMEQIAMETGGQAIFNSSDLNTSLNRVIHLGAHYYTLVYTPANKKMNGDFRRIEVKVNAGKYKLEYRHGYYASDSSRKLDAGAARSPANGQAGQAGQTEQVEQADPRIQRLRAMLSLGMADATEVLYGVRVLPAATQPASKAAGANPKLTEPTTRYTVDFLLDPKKIKFLPADENTHQGWIRVELVAFDGAGRALNWNGATLRTKLNPADYAAVEKSGIPVHLEIDVPRDGVSLATGIYDLEADKAGTLEVPLSPASTAVAATP